MPALLINAHAGITGLVLAAAAKKSSSGSPVFLILIVVLVGVYFLWLRPQRRRQQAQARTQRQAEVGDEVVTTSGIYGRVVSLDGDRASLEIAPGTTIEVARRALGQRVDPVVPDDEPDEDGEDTGTGFGHPGYDGHDDLDDPPYPTASADGAEGVPSGSEAEGDDDKAPGGSS